MSSARTGYLGPYRLLSVVNTSQHCRLWRGMDDSRGRVVAIKALLERFQADRAHIDALKRELAVVGTVEHERIIRIFDFGIDRDVPYLVMEWFPSPNLKVRLRRGLEDPASLIPRVVTQTAEALVVLNGRGWVHRDVKPENFLVSDAGDVKLIDFSLAKRRKHCFSKLFGGWSKVQGTPSYMSPEQIRGEPLDERADVYSLGCTWFEMLAGRPPYTAAGTNELLSKHLRAAVPSVEGINEAVAPAFGQLIRRAMAKDARERPASMRELYSQVLETPIFRRPPRPVAALEQAES